MESAIEGGRKNRSIACVRVCVRACVCTCERCFHKMGSSVRSGWLPAKCSPAMGSHEHSQPPWYLQCPYVEKPCSRVTSVQVD